MVNWNDSQIMWKVGEICLLFSVQNQSDIWPIQITPDQLNSNEEKLLGSIFAFFWFISIIIVFHVTPHKIIKTSGLLLLVYKFKSFFSSDELQAIILSTPFRKTMFESFHILMVHKLLNLAEMKTPRKLKILACSISFTNFTVSTIRFRHSWLKIGSYKC